MKKTIVFLAGIFIILSGVILIINNDTTDDVIKFGFSSSEPGESDKIIFMKGEELSSYEFLHENTNTRTYYSGLNETEKQIYLAFWYAFENCYEYVMINRQLNEMTERGFEEMLYFLSLDSPLVEQNVTVRMREYTVNEGVFFFDKRELNYIGYNIDIFNKEKYDKKTEAVKRAEELLEKVPAYFTLAEKAEWLYKYMGENIEYDASLSKEESNYLYDALLRGATQCDGFANAYSLLLNMLGIPSFEKINKAEEGKEGHTWNSFKIGEEWYNADVTAYYQLLSYKCPANMFFGYSDDLQTSDNLYGEMLPVCGNVLNLSCSFENEKDPNLVKNVYDSYKSSMGYVTIKFEDRLEDPEGVMAMISGYIGGNIYYISIDNRLFCIYRR